jgi:hypothetical protein
VQAKVRLVRRILGINVILYIKAVFVCARTKQLRKIQRVRSETARGRVTP